MHTAHHTDADRGTWFWRGDNGEYIPYEEGQADKLETAFKMGKFEPARVDIDGVRYAVLTPDGRNMKQMR